MTTEEFELIEKMSKQVADLSGLVKTIVENQLTLQEHIKELYMHIRKIHQALGLKVKKKETPNVTC
jgi:hypothetical protein